jgi:hypothetical protein
MPKASSGARRATPKPVLARREALHIALDRFPTATPSTILQRPR